MESEAHEVLTSGKFEKSQLEEKSNVRLILIISLLFQEADKNPESKVPPNLDLTMTAKEMREMLLRRKKKDPRKEERMDMMKRVEMVEAL